MSGTLPARALWLQLQWGDGGPNGDGYRFDISRIGIQRELEEACNAGVRAIMRRLVNGDERVAYYRETIRLGLIGGGLTPPQAMKLVQTYVDARPRAESIESALHILGTLVVGRPEDADDEDTEAGAGADAGKPPAAATETSDATSPLSTAPPPQSASTPEPATS